MKKLIYSALAMAFAFFAASCQQENLEPVAESNTVTYTVKVPGAMSTKALGDETTAVNKVYYQVYRAAEVDDLTKTFVYDGTEDVNDAGQASFELDFVKNQNFVVLFWAQKSTLDMYNTTDLRKVQLVNPGDSNNAAAQVFAGSNFVTDCVPANGGNVELTRPISQLNIFTTKESLTFGGKTIGLVKSTVTVDGLYTTYNVAEGAAVVTPTPAKFIYDADTVPATEDTDPYAYVAMNYVGFAPNASTTVQVDFTITTSEGDVPHSVSSVPVKPNYRTNIVGNLLTESADYDVTLDAAWAGENIIVNNADEFAAAIARANDGDVINLADGEYDLPTSLFAQASSGTFTFNGSGVDTEVKGASSSNVNAPGVYANGKHLIFKDLTYVTPNNGYNGGFGHAASVTFINCTIVGQFYAHSGAPHYFYDCTIDPLTGYLYTYGSDCVFEGCTFSASEGKALQVYQDAATGETTVTIKDCDFVAAKQAATWDGKPVTGIDINSNGALFNVYVENCTTTGFPTGLNSGSDLYNIKNGGFAKVNLWIDGEQVAFVGLTPVTAGVGIDANGAYNIFNADGMLWFANEVNTNGNSFSGKTVKLTDNIDLNGIDWKPISQTGATQFKGTFDGQNNTISNLTIDTTDKGGNYASGLFGWIIAATVKNVNIDGADIMAQHYVGGIAGYLEWDGCTVENCHVTNANIVAKHNAASCGNKVGGIVGFAGNADTLVKECTVSNSTIVADRDAGQVVGAAKTTNVVNCSASNVTVSVAEGCTDEDAGKNVRAEVIGRVL